MPFHGLLKTTRVAGLVHRVDAGNHHHLAHARDLEICGGVAMGEKSQPDFLDALLEMRFSLVILANVVERGLDVIEVGCSPSGVLNLPQQRVGAFARGVVRHRAQQHQLIRQGV